MTKELILMSLLAGVLTFVSIMNGLAVLFLILAHPVTEESYKLLKRASIMAGISIGLLVALLYAHPARAEDRGAWFKSLRQPGTGMSCCDVADCHQTMGDYRAGSWWAEIRGQFVQVPWDKVLTKRTIDGEAYVCTGVADTILCFVPPDFGS